MLTEIARSVNPELPAQVFQGVRQSKNLRGLDCPLGWASSRGAIGRAGPIVGLLRYPQHNINITQERSSSHQQEPSSPSYKKPGQSCTSFRIGRHEEGRIGEDKK